VSNPVKEFHMGLFFHTSSWRKPLQLIECWLPEPVQVTRPASVTRPVSAMPTAAVRRFAQAGWLGRPAANEALPRARHDGRVALAGRIDEVCRELDRLADRETRARPRCTRQAR
jgi:hypothetical protein